MELNQLAIKSGVAIKTYEESPVEFVERLYQKLTGRNDFDLIHSTLALLNVLTDDQPTRRNPSQAMRDRLHQTVKSNLDEIKAEDIKTDADFLKSLKGL